MPLSIYHIFLVALELMMETPLHLSETEIFLRANDCQANPETQFIIKFIRDPGLILAEIENRRSIDIA